MRYELMRPHQIRDFIARDLPIVLPLGVLEYHGPHLGVGLDTLVVTRMLERLEAEAELRIGFRNIHFVVHHQTENFAAGMPTDLAFKFGARQAIFAFLEETRGQGWWGRSEMADY